MFDRAASSMNGLNDGQKAHVKAQHLVFGMIRNPNDLVRVKARVQGMQYATGTTHTKVQLQVTVAIPGQRGYPVAEGQLHLVQGIGHPARTQGNVFVVSAVDITLYPTRHNFAFSVVTFCKNNQGRDQQLLVLH